MNWEAFVWFALLVFFIAVEASTVTVVSIWFAAGALGAIIVALTGGGLAFQVTVFLALDSYVELYKGGIIPLEQFAAMKKDNDILVRLIVKKTPCKVVYTSMRNQRTDFPVIACAVAQMNGEYRASIGARPARAILIRSKQAEGLASFVAGNAPTEGNIRGSAAYRTHLIKVLVRRAMQELGITGLENLMEGPNAFVFGTGDVTDAPKVINQFIEKNKLQSLEIKGGLMGEEVLDANGVKAIAALPGREELLATLVGCLVSPVSSLVAVLDEIAEKKAA